MLTSISGPRAGGARSRRVGALIEVSAGFHPDLTGRENVFLQGAIMGMRAPRSRASSTRSSSSPAIDEFIDTPVKRYSSG